MNRTLVIMVKVPRPGRVKTRLGKGIGMVAAAWWFRHQTRTLMRRLRDPRWQIVLAVSPDAEGLCFRGWPGDLPRMAQGQGSLGDRMARALRSAPPGRVCLIGADIPGIRRHHIARAFATLGQHDAVFGPAPDGGYWLVGLKQAGRIPAGLFDKVRWSSSHALSDSMASLPGKRIALVDQLRDVDTAKDLLQTL
ncbi:MAG: TIGR04282 family arsenosugar biosynthesis glycosyltransferase [Rhodobacteraceae bacterium]|nr:TIGR04282 family arsenosugar biosynthesis glycosyltransferase [Paracoccaceae bacterium]